ncbi:hypothetical protein VTK73DRAFT_8364 [Phialemonium thermophilum]|uniref:Uncharacterized protein n=1 Tax=Phialemonium thermophilum TaxID=223376 RepID=A0ABR3XQH5_9PEZI
MGPKFAELPLESGILAPLPDGLSRGLTAVAVLASISFASSSALLLYLTYKLIRWRIRLFKSSEQDGLPVADFSLGLAERHFGGTDVGDGRDEEGQRKNNLPNQFLALFYNLLRADMDQAAAFLLNAVWVATDGIQVGTPTCFTQGLLVSNGDLASSCFITWGVDTTFELQHGVG